MDPGKGPTVMSDRPMYSRTIFEAILDGIGRGYPLREDFRLDDRGAWIKDPGSTCGLEWHPLCEVMAPSSVNPLDEPWLPFPFSARQLAALMTDEWGYFIREKYGDWEGGPQPDERQSIGQLGGKAKEALAAAYEEYRDAVELAPRLDKRLEATARELAEAYDNEREAAIERERLRESGISDAEYGERLVRVNEAVTPLDRLGSEARKAADDAYSSWRKAVVQHLLLPFDQVPTEAFEHPPLRALPASRRREAIQQRRMQREFDDSEAGEAHWDLISQQHDVERELRRWQLMNPLNVTEAAILDIKLRELKAELAAITERLKALEAVPPKAAAQPECPEGSPAADPNYALLATPAALCAAFEGYGLKKSWFDDLSSRQWLLQARKVKGQGQRGRRIEPMFCPFEVMIGLVERSRKSQLKVDTGWRLLESHFPAVHATKSVADPRERTG